MSYTLTAKQAFDHDYPPRLDVAGVEWECCDPFPTWFRRSIYRTIVLRPYGAPPWADEPWTLVSWEGLP